jgi:Secretion system C-terminal sorting domain
VIENNAEVFFGEADAVLTNTTLNSIFTCDLMGFVEDQFYPCSTDSVFFANPLNYVDQYEWMLDTLLLSSSAELALNVDPGSSYDLILVASNPICEVWYDLEVAIDSLPEVLLFTDLGYEMENLEYEVWGTYLLATSNESYTYQWFLDDQLLVGETNDSLVAGVYALYYGYFTVVVTNEDGCSNSSSGLFNFWSVEDTQLKSIQIFPNPTSDFLQVKSELNIVTAAICQADGRMLTQWNPSAANFFVDVRSFAPGVYLFTAVTSQGTFTRRFIVP